jgi:ADP-ribose pyrophosphatase YjhB (NUDIX family)
VAEPQPLSEADFHAIYSRVPRLTVEIVLADERGVLLTRRAIEPCLGLWHLPGGTVRFGEPLMEAVRRVAADELDVSVEAARMLGYIEYPGHVTNGVGCPVGLAFLVTEHHGGVRLNAAASEYGWFTRLPPDMHEAQWQFIEQVGLVQSATEATSSGS